MQSWHRLRGRSVSCGARVHSIPSPGWPESGRRAQPVRSQFPARESISPAGARSSAPSSFLVPRRGGPVSTGRPGSAPVPRHQINPWIPAYAGMTNGPGSKHLGAILYLSTPNLLSSLTINCVSLKIKCMPLSGTPPSRSLLEPAVHPRPCGGTIRSLASWYQLSGLSPRLRGNREALVEPRQELLQHPVGFPDAARPRQPEFSYQPVLERSHRAIHPALGLGAGVGHSTLSRSRP